MMVNKILAQSKINLSNIKKVAVLAGKGWLPKHVYTACQEKGIQCEIIGLEGQTSAEIFAGIEYETFPLHSVSKIINKLKAGNIKYLVLAGKIKRSSISKLLLDLKGAKLLTMIIKSGLNDSAVLGSVISFLEKEGFTIVPSEIIADNLVIKKGTLTKVKPTDNDMQDIKKGTQILKAIATFDVGQALVIQNGLVLGIEAVEGTDQLIKRCGEVQQVQERCILLKVCKPNQDRRVDLPCIGPDTIKNIHKYNLKGIGVEAGASLILDQESTIAEADKLGIFIYGIDTQTTL